jgi:hypothetical protein
VWPVSPRPCAGANPPTCRAGQHALYNPRRVGSSLLILPGMRAPRISCATHGLVSSSQAGAQAGLPGSELGLRPPIQPTRGLNRRVKSGPGPPAAEASCERRNKRSPRRRSKSFVSFKKFGAEAAGLQNPSFGPHAEPFASDRGRGLRDVDNAGSAALLAHSDRAADQQEIDSTPPWITRIIARVPVLCHTKTTSRDFSDHGWRWS